MTDDLPDYLARPPEPSDPRERLMIVARSVEDGRYLLVRREGQRALGLLSTEPPHRSEGLATAVRSVVGTHLGVTVRGEPRRSELQHPVHTLHPYTGGQSTSYLRVIAVEVIGEPKADALFSGLEALPLDDARRAVSTNLEEELLNDGATLLGEGRPADG